MNALPRLALATGALWLLASVAHGFQGDYDAPLPWGRPADHRTCPDEESRLWVPLPTGDACLRYFGPAGLGHSPTLIVYLTGDRDSLLSLPPERIDDNTWREQSLRSTRLSQRAKVPVVMLARPGTYGSSGDHRHRRRLAEEFAPIDGALDALKRRYGVERFVLWGHSGGATAAAAMLTLGRTDVRCVVMTSSTFAYLERWRMRRGKDGNSPSTPRELQLAARMYDPLEHVEDIVRDPGRTVYVLGDPRDTVTPFVLQARFADALRRAGHRVVLREVEAAPQAFHDIRGEAGFLQASRCAREEDRSARQTER